MQNDEFYTDNFEDYNQNVFKKFFNSFKIDKKMLFLCIFVLIIGVGLYILGKNVIYYGSYEYLEDTLEKAAKEYVDSNNIKSNREFYIEVRNLPVDLKEDCSNMSGVLVNGNNYQAYLFCDSYETKVFDNDISYIKLNGKEVVFLNKGERYAEPYFENEKKLKVNINGTVGTEEGVYNLEYVVMQYDVIVSRLKRKVVVLDDKKINDYYPTISLLGNEIEYLKLGEDYADKGVVAKDKNDGIINDVFINGEVNTNSSGEYNLVYTAINSKGYASSIGRRVVVLKRDQAIAASSILSPSSLTNQDVKITMSIYGDKYAYTELPNGERISKSLIEYVVSENGTYNFKIYDTENRYVVESVKVDNIVRTAPNGTCMATVYSNYTTVSTNAISNIGISGYKYIINNQGSSFNSSSTYNINHSDVKTLKVVVKDIVGNEQDIECVINYIDPSVGNDNVKYYYAFNDTYVIPKTRNDLDTFVGNVRGKISQNADRENCGSACLSFSLYHAYYLQYGNMEKMNLYDACHYIYPIGFDIIYEKSERAILEMIYDELLAGRVIVLQVDNNKNGRHFALVVGYRRSVYNKKDLRMEDLIFIDSWDGLLESGANSTREMFNDESRGGYRVDKIKSKYYSLWP